MPTVEAVDQTAAAAARHGSHRPCFGIGFFSRFFFSGRQRRLLRAGSGPGELVARPFEVGSFDAATSMAAPWMPFV